MVFGIFLGWFVRSLDPEMTHEEFIERLWISMFAPIVGAIPAAFAAHLIYLRMLRPFVRARIEMAVRKAQE